MDGTSIVSLPAEENMRTFDLESYSHPLAEFLPTQPLRNDLPFYHTPTIFDSDDDEDEEEGRRPMSHWQFENLPLQPLPTSTAAELSWSVHRRRHRFLCISVRATTRPYIQKTIATSPSTQAPPIRPNLNTATCSSPMAISA